MRRIKIALLIFASALLACAPQSKVNPKNPGGSEQVAPPRQENDTVRKLDEYLKASPPAVVKPPAPAPIPTVAPGKPARAPAQPQAPAPGAPPKSDPITETELRTPAQNERARPTSPVKKAQTPGVKLNFENADIHDVTKVVSEITNKSFIVDKDVEGPVTIYSEESLTPEQVFDLFQSVLELQKLAIVQVGDFYKIVKSGEAQKRNLNVDAGRAPAEDDQLITQIVRLKHIRAGAIQTVLKPLTPAEIIVPDEQGNTLIITDTGSNLRKLLEIIKEIDVGQYTDIFWIKYADLTELINDLSQILSVPGVAGTVGQMTPAARAPEIPAAATAPAAQAGAQPAAPAPTPAQAAQTSSPAAPATPAAQGEVVPPGTRTKLYPIPRLNALLVSTNSPDVLSLVRQWIETLDRPSDQDSRDIENFKKQRTLYIYPVQYKKAEELADMLQKMFGGGVQAFGTSAQQPAAQTQQPAQPQPQQQVQPQPAVQTPAGGSSGETRFFADKATNSLILKATPAEYAEIKRFLDDLDLRPLQVLIDVIIAEVTLSDSDTFGVQGMLQAQDQITIAGETNSVTALADSTFSGVTAGDGLMYTVTAPGRFLMKLRALATESKVKVLSDPHILVLNNQEAEINIGDNIPIKEVTGTGDTAKENIRYEKTGIILTVKPQINNRGSVTMEIKQEVSTPGTKATGESAPPINRTTARTFLVTDDGQPLVIGGLINSRDRNDMQGIPLLKDIPLLGRLFRFKDKTTERKELIILVTPRVVRTQQEGWRLTDNVLERRIKQLEDLFNREATDADKVKGFIKEQFIPQE